MAGSNKTWYDDVFKKGLRRSTGENEITESNSMDWQRLRVLKNGQLVPFMPKGHIGAPSEIDLDALRREAENGNVFLYRLGEEYPWQLTDGEWYSTDPAIKEEKQPEAKMPVEPLPPKEPRETEPFPYASRLESMLKANKLPNDVTLLTGETEVKYRMMLDDLEAERKRFEKAEDDLCLEDQRRYDAERKIYEAELQAYEAEKARRTQEHNVNLQNWQKRTGFYDKLSNDVKDIIRNEAPQRKVEVLQNQEIKRALNVDRKPLEEWYQKEFRVNMVQPRTKPLASVPNDKEHLRLAETDGIDWGRLRIWNGEKFERVLPADHKGPPTTEALKNLREAAESGNLFVYHLADKYPSKWMGNHWSSMNKDWIDSLKPKTMEEQLKELPEPKMSMKEPKLEDFTKGVSNGRVRMNRFLGVFRIKAFQSEVEKLATAISEYEKQLELYSKALKTYDEDMEKYNNEVEARQNLYNQRMPVYENMLKNYNSLTLRQRAAMEQDARERAEEIRRNKEAEQKKADELTVEQHAARKRLNNAEARMDTLNPQPQVEQFLGGPAALGQNAYEVIAPHGYNLPEGSKVTLKDAAAIHLALAGSNQAVMNRGISPMNADRYGQMLEGVLHGNPTGEELQYISASYNAAKQYIEAYNAGNPGPLAEAMGEGMRNLINASRNALYMSPEMAGLAKVAERMFNVLDKDQQLLNNCGLSKEELNYARGLVQIGKTYNENLDAQIRLTEHSTGAKQYNKDELVVQTVDLLAGKTLENHLNNAPQEVKEQTVATVGKVEGTGLDTAKTVLKQNPAVQQIVTQPGIQNETDLNKRTTEVMKGIQSLNLQKPKEDPKIVQQVRKEVKQSINENNIKAKEKKNQLNQKQTEELTLARGVLAQKDPSLAQIDLEDPKVKDMLASLKEAQTNLLNQSRMKNNGEAKEFALNDPKVVEDAALRSEVRKLMAKENETTLHPTTINSDTVTVRISGLQRAKERLKNENLSLTDIRVVLEEREKREADIRKLSNDMGDRLQAQDVLNRENGVTVNKPGDWRGADVDARMKELKAARDKLGPEYANLPLNNMKVIQQDYKTRNFDPFKKGGIVDVTKLSANDRVEYEERMQTIDYLKRQNPNASYKFRDKIVSDTMGDLRKSRRRYEYVVQTAKKDLPLSDPAIEAMHVVLDANNRKDLGGKNFTESEIATIAQELKGKTPAERKRIGEQALKIHKAGKEIGQNLQTWKTTMRINVPKDPLKLHIPGMNN